MTTKHKYVILDILKGVLTRMYFSDNNNTIKISRPTLVFDITSENELRLIITELAKEICEEEKQDDSNNLC